MKKELQDKLFEKYPKIFGNKDLSPKQTCMCWGLECGDGWYMLIDELCNKLQWDTDHNNRKESGNEGRNPQVVAAQVKEKYAGLRFYVDSCTDVQQGAISFAESLSFKICEDCGSTDDVATTDSSWYRSLCPKCRDDTPLLRDRQFSEKVLNSEVFKKTYEEDNEN